MQNDGITSAAYWNWGGGFTGIHFSFYFCDHLKICIIKKLTNDRLHSTLFNMVLNIEHKIKYSKSLM